MSSQAARSHMSIGEVLALLQGFRTMFTAGGRDDVAVFLRPGANSEGDSQFSRDRGLKLIKSLPEVEVSEHGPLASMEAYLAVLLPPSRGGVTNVPLRGVQQMTFEIRGPEVTRAVSAVAANPDVREFYLGIREGGIRGQRRWRRRKTWR